MTSQTSHAGALLGLPHDAPALLIEALETSPQGDRTATFVVHHTSHWTIDRRLSAAGVVEAMAQAAALCAGGRPGSDASDVPTPGPGSGVVIGAETLTITSLPCLGQTVRARSLGVRAIGPALWAEVELRTEAEIAARGVVKLLLGPEPLHGSVPGGGASAHAAAVPPARTSSVLDDVRAAVLEQTAPADADGLDLRCRYPASLPIFAAHFPGRPLVPGVYLLQLALDLLPSLGEQVEPPLTVTRAKLARPLLPEQEHVVQLRLDRTATGRRQVRLRVRASAGQRRPAAELVLEPRS